MVGWSRVCTDLCMVGVEQGLHRLMYVWGGAGFHADFCTVWVEQALHRLMYGWGGAGFHADFCTVWVEQGFAQTSVWLGWSRHFCRVGVE